MNYLRLLIFFHLLWCSKIFSQEQKTDHINKLESNYLKLYFEAENYKMMGEHEKAILSFEKCISINDLEPSAYYEMAKLYFSKNEWESAEYYIQQAVKINPQNKWYYYLLMELFAVQNKVSEQVDVYSHLIEIFPNNLKYYQQKINLLSHLKEYKTAIRVIKRAEKKFGVNMELIIQRMKIYLSNENFKDAEKTGRYLIEQFPQNPQSYNELGAIYLHFSHYDSATLVYQKLLTIHPDNPTGLMALYKIYENRGEATKKGELLLKIIDNNNISLDTKRELLYSLFIKPEDNDIDLLYPAIDLAAKYYPTETFFQVVLADFAGKDENYEKAVLHYKKALEAPSLIKQDYIYNKLLEMLFYTQDYTSIVETANKGLESYPFYSRFFYLKGLALMNLQKYHKALSSLVEGVQFIIDDRNMSSEFYSLMGDIHHKLNNHEKSDEAYEMSLKFNDTNTFVLNNYSYYLALRNTKLELAQDMIEKCNNLTVDSPNASFLDTHAWVLYKLEKYTLAKEKIEMAIKLDQSSSTLFDHYGDILAALQDFKNAIIQWKIASHLDAENHHIRAKISQHE